MSEASSMDCRVRCVVVGVDSGGLDVSAVVIAKVLTDNSIEIVRVEEVPSEPKMAVPLLPFWSAESPPIENISYGPQRKGRGGKFRRW